MKTLHIGHHFFGAGNLGDDFMLAGFLGILASRGPVQLTCCVPHPIGPLAARFPQVRWLSYTPEERERAIGACDAWLGLGGSPFQIAVSSWFSDHLAVERAACGRLKKPMYFLGVGGQDEGAYADSQLKAAAEGAAGIWTRDPASAEALQALAPGRVWAGADLAHLYFSTNPVPAAVPGRLTAVLNFDYESWPGLNSCLEALSTLPTWQRIWLSQESRPLPGAEQVLYQALPPEEKRRWTLEIADSPGKPLADVLARWPSGEWLLSSRYHATLAGAWAGSRGAVIATNAKLKGAAAACGYPAISKDALPNASRKAFEQASPPPRSLLRSHAESAKAACESFFASVGI